MPEEAATTTMADTMKDASVTSRKQRNSSFRNCCCRYGWLPALIAPILTAAFILSLYSSAGCDFVDVSVGFIPSNAAWNTSSQLELGLFLVHDPDMELENRYRQRWLPGCTAYPPVFSEVFMSHDKTWRVSRIMAIIAADGGGLAVLLSWLMVLTPVPTGMLWPCLLLPIVMLSFIAEGSKFLFFDVALCSNALWFPSGNDAVPQQAQECSLGKSGMFGVAASALLLVALLMVCLLSPRRRGLNVQYGMDFLPNDDHDLGHEQTDEEDLRKSDEVEEEEDDEDETTNQAFDGFSDYDESVYTNGREPSIISRKNSEGSDDIEHGTKNEEMMANDASAAVSLDDPEPIAVREHISESRISKYQELAMNTTGGDEKYIQSLVDDLDLSLTNSYVSSCPLDAR